MIATAFTLVLLFSLGRHFAVLPAARGVTFEGTYRYLRHPIYAGELMMTLACLLANPGVLSFTVMICLVPTLVLRIEQEERATPWKLLPGFW